MKRIFRLSETDIKAAILLVVAKEMGIGDINSISVRLTAEEARDQMDRPSYGHTITATVEEK